MHQRSATTYLDGKHVYYALHTQKMAHKYECEMKCKQIRMGGKKARTHGTEKRIYLH